MLSRACGRGEPARRTRPPVLLSNLRDLQGELLGPGERGRSGERLVQPGPKVPVGEELELEQRYQIRQGPTERGPELEVLQDQQGNQRRPELDVEGIGARPSRRS